MLGLPVENAEKAVSGTAVPMAASLRVLLAAQTRLTKPVNIQRGRRLCSWA